MTETYGEKRQRARVLPCALVETIKESIKGVEGKTRSHPSLLTELKMTKHVQNTHNKKTLHVTLPTDLLHIFTINSPSKKVIIESTTK